jgi:hypothetical protein
MQMAEERVALLRITAPLSVPCWTLRAQSEGGAFLPGRSRRRRSSGHQEWGDERQQSPGDSDAEHQCDGPVQEQETVLQEPPDVKGAQVERLVRDADDGTHEEALRAGAVSTPRAPGRALRRTVESLPGPAERAIRMRLPSHEGAAGARGFPAHS